MQLSLVCLVVVATACVVTAAPQGTYTTKYDNINLDEILNSDRLLKNYVNCLLEKGKCTPDGKELKESLPDALETNCQKCSEKQKAGSDKIIRFLVNKKPEVWKELSAKYDPEGKYAVKYRDQAKDLGIPV